MLQAGMSMQQIATAVNVLDRQLSRCVRVPGNRCSSTRRVSVNILRVAPLFLYSCQYCYCEQLTELFVLNIF